LAGLGWGFKFFESRATGHLSVLAAARILATNRWSDVMDLAFPAVLGRDFGEPWARSGLIFRFGAFPQSVSKRVSVSFNTAYFTQYIFSIQVLPELDVGFSKLIVVIEVTAALPTLMTLESVHVCPYRDTGPA
jgi:hypothetical protein